MALGKRNRNPDWVSRSVIFAIPVTKEQEECLLHMSTVMRSIWGSVHEKRRPTFETHYRPLREQFKIAYSKGDEPEIDRLRNLQKDTLAHHPLPSVHDHINALTPRPLRGINGNWQEECVKMYMGAFDSYMSLRVKRDKDAEPPSYKSEGMFCEIRGRSGFSIAHGVIEIRPGAIGKGLEYTFPIKEYQWGILKDIPRKRIKSFTLLRAPADLQKAGEYRIQVSYEIPKPETKPFDAEQATYLWLGASWVGVLGPQGEELIPLERPDFRWMSRINDLRARIDPPEVSTKIHALTPGSITWRKRTQRFAQMHSRRKYRGREDRRDIVAYLIREYGPHFVINDFVIRSKPGRLADKTKPERRGERGPNFAAQNTRMAYLPAWLTIKIVEFGGTVQKHALTVVPPDLLAPAHERKIPLVHSFRDDFLKSLG